MYYKKLFEKLKQCAKLNVPITSYDRLRYNDLFNQNPQAFGYNATKDFFMMQKKFVYEGKRWCGNCAGRTRHGKSEVVQTWTMIYIDIYNEALESGAYKNHTKQGINYKMQKLPKLNADDILFSQSNYLYHLRNDQKQDDLIYGKPRIVDEDQDKTGGLGSYSERLELDNIDNITAQALQSEWQLRPDKFVLVNAPYCLFQEKMDMKNKINWSMLYEQMTHPTATQRYVFKGWVATPLHTDHKLRVKYNENKKKNILLVIEGKGDLRLLERQKVAKLLCEDMYFSMRTESGKKFKYSKHQQETILNEWITNGKVQNFNEMEKLEIVEYARMLSERRYLEGMQKEK